MNRLLCLVLARTAICFASRADDSAEPLVVVRYYRVPANAFPAPTQMEWLTESGTPFVAPPIPSYLYLREENRLIVRGTSAHHREAKASVAELWRKAKTKKPPTK